MLDTGVSYSLAPAEDIQSVAKALRGYSLNCELPASDSEHLSLYSCSNCNEGNFRSLQPLQLLIGGREFDLPVESYIQKSEDENCKLLIHPFDTSFGSDSKWVLGLKFLQNYKSVFDLEQRRIALD
mmetsp:Transcript_6586/g.11122  ORF Transcript_6586/g.11122 Transcript_6586/m.11122 type:complete len:126 (-) Transcript_6586:30-407(-)